MKILLWPLAFAAILGSLPAEARSVCGPEPIDELVKTDFENTSWTFYGEAGAVLAAKVTLAAGGALEIADGPETTKAEVSAWDFVEDPNAGRGLYFLNGAGEKIFSFPWRSIGEAGQSSMAGVRYGKDGNVALEPICTAAAQPAAEPAAAPAASPASGGAAIPLSVEGLTGTSWMQVDEAGSPSIKDMKLDAEGKIGGGAEGGFVEKWEIADGKLVLWAQGGSKYAVYETSTVSAGGRPTLTGFTPDFPEIKLRMIQVLSPEAVAAMMTVEALTGTTWQLRNDDGSVAQEKIELLADGKVGGVAADDYWIDSWTVEEGKLVLKKGSSANFRFDLPTEDATGRRVLVGYLTMNAYQELTLVETGGAK